MTIYPPTLQDYIELIDELFYLPDQSEDEMHWAADPASTEEAVRDYIGASLLIEFHQRHYDNQDGDRSCRNYHTIEYVLRKALGYLQDRDYYGFVLGAARTRDNKGRASEYVGKLLSSGTTDDEFIRLMRMSKRSFIEWENEVESFSTIHETTELSLRICLAIHLHVLGGMYQHTAAAVFSLSRTIILQTFRQVSIMIALNQSRFIKMPPWIDQPVPSVLQLEENEPLKDCWGIMDNTHIKFTARYTNQPRGHYYSIKKATHTTTTLCICTLDEVGSGTFIYVSSQYPGRRGDGATLIQELEKGLGEMIPPDKFIIADGGYCNTPWLVTTFPMPRDIDNLPEEARLRMIKLKKFNHRISEIRIRVEQNFGILKMKFQKLYRGNDYGLSRQPDIIVTAFCIFNFLRRQKCPSFAADERELGEAIMRSECDLSGDLFSQTTIINEPFPQSAAISPDSSPPLSTIPDQEPSADNNDPQPSESGRNDRNSTYRSTQNSPHGEPEAGGPNHFPQGHMEDNPWIQGHYRDFPNFSDTNTIFHMSRYPGGYREANQRGKGEYYESTRKRIFDAWDALGHLG